MVPSTYGVTDPDGLRDAESLSKDIQCVSDRTESHLTRSLKVLLRKKDGVSPGRTLHSFLGHPHLLWGAFYSGFTERAQCDCPPPGPALCTVGSLLTNPLQSHHCMFWYTCPQACLCPLHCHPQCCESQVT